MELNMAFNGTTDLKDYDTRKINVQFQATFLRNLFSPLVDYDLNGQLTLGIAEKFWWDDGKLIFSFGSKSKTNKGNLITAEDALISLKRLIKDGNNHGDIGLILCPNIDKSKIMEKDCPGLKIDNGNLVLTPAKEIFKEYLLPLLASVDFRIIPRSSLDNEFSEIVSFSETSGPYFIDSVSKDKIVLKVNIHSYLYSNRIPQIINLVIVENGKSAVNGFLAGRIDLIPTIMPLTIEESNQITNELKSNIEIFNTHFLKIFSVFFTKQAINKFSTEERFYFASRLVERIKNTRGVYDQDTIQYFQDFGEGYLNKEQSKEIQNLRDTIKVPRSKLKPTVAVSKANEYRWGQFFENHPEFEKSYIPSTVYAIPVEKRPDIYIDSVDVAFNSSPALLSYALKVGMFGMNGDEGDKWFAEYLNLDTKSRLQKLNELHFNVLKNCYLYPVTCSPYVAIVRKPWSLNLNKFFAATNLWQIHSLF